MQRRTSCRQKRNGGQKFDSHAIDDISAIDQQHSFTNTEPPYETNQSLPCDQTLKPDGKGGSRPSGVKSVKGTRSRVYNPTLTFSLHQGPPIEYCKKPTNYANSSELICTCNNYHTPVCSFQWCDATKVQIAVRSPVDALSKTHTKHKSSFLLTASVSV